MIGRLFRLLVGLGILGVATDIWDPTLLPHGIPVSLGQFEDLRTPAACLLGVVGFALGFAAVWPRPAKRRRSVSVSAIALTSPPTLDPPLESNPAQATAVEPIFDEVRPALISASAPASPVDAIFPAPFSETAVAPAPSAASARPTAPEVLPAAPTVLTMAAIPFAAAAIGHEASASIEREPPPETAEAVAVTDSLEPSAPWCEIIIEAPNEPGVALDAPALEPPGQVQADRETVVIPFPGKLTAHEIARSPEPATAPSEALAAPPSESEAALGGESETPPPSTFDAATSAGDKDRLDGHLDEAMDKYEEALELARDQLKAAPGDARARRDLAAALTNIGDIYDLQGRLEPAIEAHEESLKLRRGLAADAPYDKSALRGLSLGLERLADTREARGHRSRALDLYQESLPIAERLAAEHPDDALHAQDLETTKARIEALQREMTPAD